MDGPETHVLPRSYTIWIHLPSEKKWTIDGYINLGVVNSAEQLVDYLERLGDMTLKGCMIFIMREGILPLWEDIMNMEGGGYSYKVADRFAPETFKTLAYKVTGNSLSQCDEKIHGISLSPKRNFVIIKIWVGADAREIDLDFSGTSLGRAKGVYRQHKGSK